MPDDLNHVLRACNDLGGVARLADLRSAGAGREDIDRAVRAGSLTRLRRGWYGWAGISPALAAAVRHGGALGCISVLQEHGLWILGEHPHVHVAMRPNGQSLPHPGCRCVLHWNAVPRSGGRVSLRTALAQALGCIGAEEFFVALESAMRRRAIDGLELAALRQDVPADRRWLVDLARWDADSGLESLLRLRLHALGMTLRSQVEIPGVGRVDFVLGDRLILEVDGRLNHEAPPKRHKDLIRDAVAAAHGFDTLRFDSALLVYDWPLVEAAILAKLELGLHVSVRPRSRGRRARRGIRSTR
ncbi:very-short-patch-repair endonuclease [Agromyces sp. 3263]|uniref:type IV toxin-antitoxin system AbiEi family antitoxin domain-containing protein n=1 Tax=Agromyces sp. 3263 TaxID=2817750 RepID=UPI00286627F1|nr:type IV toxin-antitoxin system AbiEi family antitoxin domain-containing protein [Agromyces sp. 3263]MDR6904368.1 very-short-patch-repair endonuclease [Agromyces sp. 3263]